MTQSQFDEADFKPGSKVIYKGEERLIMFIDYHFGNFKLDGINEHIPFSECEVKDEKD